MPTYSYDDTYDVPSDAIYLEFEVNGAGGEGGTVEDEDSTEYTDGGDGARVEGKLPVADVTSTLDIYVGDDPNGSAGGDNGGGDGGSGESYDGSESTEAGGGGGMSEIRPSAGSTSNAYVVAGGGGGGASAKIPGDGFSEPAGSGGDGAHPEGDRGTPDNNSEGGNGGLGGTQTSGGAGGDGLFPGADGSQAQGGDGALDTTYEYQDNVAAGGGGGAGYYGGGGGGAGADKYDEGAGGGGGGSSYVDSVAYDVTHTAGANSFGGEVTITAVVPSVSNLTAAYIGSSEADLTWDASDMDEYEVERNGSVIATVSSSEFTDAGLSENTAYDYQIYGLVEGSRSDSTDVLTVTTGGPTTTFEASLSGKTATVAASEPIGDYDELVLYRWKPSTDSGPAEIDRVTDASSYEHTDSGLLDGREYQYETETVYPRDTSSRKTATVKTILPAPTDLVVDDVRDEEADALWTANHDNGETRVDVREDDEGEWTANTSVPYDTESATATGLLNGQLYGIRVVARTPDAETVDK